MNPHATAEASGADLELVLGGAPAMPSASSGMNGEADRPEHDLASPAPASRVHGWLALGMMLAGTAGFAAVAPIARMPVPRVGAVIPFYHAAEGGTALVTAILLISQYRSIRSGALLILAGGYLFAVAMTILHVLALPSIVSDTGLVGSSASASAWVYVLWRAGVPIAVILYAAMSGCEGRANRHRGDAWPTVVVAVLAVAVAVVVLTAALAVGSDALPALRYDGEKTGVMLRLLGGVCVLSSAAFVALWVRRVHTVLDTWLMVGMCAWAIEVALSDVLSGNRAELAYCIGRAYGFLANSFVLIALLLEIDAGRQRVEAALRAERWERDRRLHELELELTHLGRVGEVAHMAFAVAHEVHQPLSAINAYIAASERFIELGQLAKGQVALRAAAAESVRAGELLQHMRSFLSKTTSSRRSERIATVVEEVTRLAKLQVREHDVAIALRLDPEAGGVLIDKVQIQQVLLNLTRNAAEAMARGARRKILISAQVVAEKWVEVSVSDTGPGLPDSVRKMLFRPFVSTKAGGMGVGLSICHMIVRAHGGRIWTSDNVGGGTVFHFTLPRDVDVHGELSRSAAA